MSNNLETETDAKPLSEPLSPTFIPSILNSIFLREAIVFPASSVIVALKVKVVLSVNTLLNVITAFIKPLL